MKSEQLLKEKRAASRDGRIYLNDMDIRVIMEAAQKDKESQIFAQNKVQAGTNFD